MRSADTSKFLRIAAGILALALLAVVLFSAFYLAAEAEHDCAGEDCPICACIRQCESILRGLGDGTALRSAAVAPVILVLIAAAFSAAAVLRNTPVSGKVRLNN